MEDHQNKGVAEWAVRKCKKRKNCDDGCDRGMGSRMGIVGTHPAVFVRVANTGLTGYGKRKSG
jgi:hypothetical protein